MAAYTLNFSAHAAEVMRAVLSATDLTRVINNISSRTMQPLIMPLMGIALYLCLAYLCYDVFAWLDRREEQSVARRQAQ